MNHHTVDIMYILIKGKHADMINHMNHAFIHSIDKFFGGGKDKYFVKPQA